MLMQHFNFTEILSVSLILFSIIDILGSIPIILEIKKTSGIHPEKATIVAGILMFLFLFLGDSILKLLGLDVASFAIAGAIIIFLLGMEMILNRRIFRNSEHASSSSSIVPLAFPIIAGAGTMTTLISLRAEYKEINILFGVVVNLVFVYIVLRSSDWIERMLGKAGEDVLRRIFGVILVAIAVKLFKTNFPL